MTALISIGRFLVDACIMIVLAFIAVFVYSLYTENPEIVTAIYCLANTDTDLGYEVCMIANN